MLSRRLRRALSVASVTCTLTVVGMPAAHADLPSLGYRSIQLDLGELRVFNEGDCALMLVSVHVPLPVGLLGTITTSYDVNDACQVVNAEAVLSVPSVDDTPGLESVGLGRSVPIPEATPPLPGTSTNYIHTSQTLQDVVNIDVAKLKTVTKRWWQPSLSLTWLVNDGYLYDAARASTSVKWNHPDSVIPGYFDYDCTNTSPCFQATSVWGSHFHTDFTWCNASSESQEMELWTQVYTYGDGYADAIFTQDVHCRGLHHATSVSQNNSSKL